MVVEVDVVVVANGLSSFVATIALYLEVIVVGGYYAPQHQTGTYLLAPMRAIVRACVLARSLARAHVEKRGSS